MIKKNLWLKNSLVLIRLIILIMILQSCSKNTSLRVQKHQSKKNIFVGIGFGADETKAIKNAKNDAIEQIFQKMGVDVNIHSKLENNYSYNNKDTFENTIKKINIDFISKAFLKIKIIDLQIKRKSKNKYYAKISVEFDEKDYQSTYRLYLKNYSRLIFPKATNYSQIIQSMKIIDKIETKMNHLSGISDLTEWKEYQLKKDEFINEYKTTQIHFSKKQINGKTLLKLKSRIKIKNGEITLKIGDKLLHKKIFSNSFFLNVPQKRVLFVPGNWKKWPKEFERVLFIDKNTEVSIKLINSSKKNRSNFLFFLSKELKAKRYKVVQNENIKPDYILKLRTKIKFYDEKIANIYFAKMDYQLKLFKNKKLILKINFPNYEFPTQKISGKNKKEVVEKISDFRNFSNYEWVAKKISDRIAEEIKK